MKPLISEERVRELARRPYIENFSGTPEALAIAAAEQNIRAAIKEAAEECAKVADALAEDHRAFSSPTLRGNG